MLEIACFTPSSALTAATHGADRIELCAHYSLGGGAELGGQVREVGRGLELDFAVLAVHVCDGVGIGRVVR